MKNLYNRKSGKNNLNAKFEFIPNRLVIFEGIYGWINSNPYGFTY